MVNNGFWRRGSFTVPAKIAHERAEEVYRKYMQRFGETLEEVYGYKVIRMLKPRRDKAPQKPFGTDDDRIRYVLWAYCTSPPATVTLDVADDQVPLLQKLGWKVK